MKVFVQDTETRLYFAGPDQWVGERAAAAAFEDAVEATVVARSLEKKNVRLVISFEDTPGELPLDTSFLRLSDVSPAAR